MKKRQNIMAASLLILFAAGAWGDTTISSTFTMVGTLQNPDPFKHFNYVNPDAPKGGIVRLGQTGSFDSLNPFITKGITPPRVLDSYGRLMVRSANEPYTLYPYLAESIEYPDDYSWVAYHLDPKARFSDGKPVTADDIIFSYEVFQNSDSLFLKNLFKDIEKVDKSSDRRVIFHLKKPGKKLVAITSYLYILPKHYWETRDVFSKHLENPVTSGPMRISHFKLGQTITYERDKNFWAKDLPALKGRYNFDKVKVDYYRDRHALLEAFKAGLIDLHIESDINQWSHAYQFPAVQDGRVIKETFEYLYPAGMNALVFNMRREKFQDIRLRKALLMAFDFEWINHKLLLSDARRIRSFYSNTPLEAKGSPSTEELRILAPFKRQLPEALFSQEASLPRSDGTGNNRNNHKQALALLQKAGWTLQKGRMINRKTGTPLTLSLIISEHQQERLLLPYRKSLDDLGIDLNIQVLDKSQFRQRVREFNFDIVDWHFWHSVYPGSEQYNTWSSDMAMEKRSGNVAGIANPVVDHLLEQFPKANHYEELIPIGRALDRVLMWNVYMIPKWYSPNLHLAYWNHLEHPPQQGLYWFNLSDWWIKPNKQVSVKASNLSPEK